MARKKRVASDTGLAVRPKLRVFISYSHGDKEQATQIAELLEASGLQPMWDKNFMYGTGFHEQIQKFIAHAHVFLPVITPGSNIRNWVHQEIGYAMALHIPVIPVALGQLPGEMIQGIHAVCIAPDNMEALRDRLSLRSIERLVERHSGSSEALYTCAQLNEHRAEMFAAYAEDVIDLGEFGVVRQKGGLSSFHIPTETINHRYWRERYGKVERSENHCELQRRERLALGRHANEKGCRLIVDPWLEYERYGMEATICRLRLFTRFLEAMSDDLCQVVFNHRMGHSESLTIVGNWFAAESVSAEVGKGYRQTIFTRHGPTVMSKLDHFDTEFEELLPQDTAPSHTRVWAIEQLTERIDELEREPRKDGTPS